MSVEVVQSEFKPVNMTVAEPEIPAESANAKTLLLSKESAGKPVWRLTQFFDTS